MNMIVFAENKNALNEMNPINVCLLVFICVVPPSVIYVVYDVFTFWLF